ncbi:transcription-repair coupling factor [Rhodocaloribacter litoris]|uniref:transcription-repair coupling factor n=1 Tax=Rhodocaloribacter litoris TaxID=2558931 RepID=UPI00141DEAE1|nr:transcription-repair coupling factor [Rhodocaloribacter litoris]QXD13721.1 transcription-repair coupling factor [Rhodocaloribacter litoris]
MYLPPVTVSLRFLADRITPAPLFDTVRAWRRTAGKTTLQVRGLSGSLPAFLIHHLRHEGPLLCLLDTPDAAAYLHSDLQQIHGDTEDLLLFPPTGHKPYDEEQITDLTPLIQRAEVLQRLLDGFTGTIVTSVPALAELIPPPDLLRDETITLAVGQTLDLAGLLDRLAEQGFERVEFVEQPGEVALRGGILDVFPFAGDYPVRIEFFGDEIDSIREFDVRTQRSISRLTATRLVPNLETRPRTDRPFTALLDALPPATVLVTFDEAPLREHADTLFAEARRAHAAATERAPSPPPPPETRYLSGDRLERTLLSFPRLMLGSFTGTPADEVLAFEAHPQPAFNSNMGLLRERLAENAARGMETIILCDSRGQEGRLRELLEDVLETGRVTLRVESLHEGFEIPALGLAVYTDHQIFNRYHRPTARRQKKRFGGLSLRELQNLQPGDFVVHVDYGIGKFAGMERITVRGRQQESVRLLYEGGDVLYVNVNALYKLNKYTGKEGHQPRLTKLGSGQWERTKARTKKRLKDIARDLIRLYAQRKAAPGHAFPPDTVWQRELEASFQYEDTPDQAAATEAVKTDMEAPTPMDRLVCGDVGFGKTEIAVRAAFKAVQDGRQVAILVPTTILAAQHYETFKTRLAPFPVHIDVLSRFRSPAEQKATLERLARGQVDIIIGTHRLISKDVRFKDLGLLIIDEEQRFGVAVKEKLRQLRVNVDTLTLTATPIPRTLQFSLMGARDLSIIATPPPNRQPIVTEIHTFDKDLIRDAILYETSRGGQVFFIHNRVQSIDEIAAMLRAIVPNVRIRVAHGQMKGSALERVMMDFVDRKFDVLVSTNIIENGLDISNANTILINHADRFGLAELHQLRGRVGRSDRKAFCYLLVPSIHGLTREARQRLQAVEEFSDLGSGFSLAMRDLDIRGAGNLLGAEQSGFIADVGFETYHKILDEAVQELQSEEFADVFERRPAPRPVETTLDVEADALIPETYLANSVERLNLYRRISEAPDADALAEIRAEMADRFGPVPPEVDNLLLAAEIKRLAEQLRLPRLLFKNERLFLYLPAQDEDPYFYEHLFYPLLEQLSRLDHRYVLKDERGKKLRAIIQQVPDLPAARDLVERLTRTVGAPVNP